MSLLSNLMDYIKTQSDLVALIGDNLRSTDFAEVWPPSWLSNGPGAFNDIELAGAAASFTAVRGANESQYGSSLLSVADHADLDPGSGDFSVAAWFKSSDTPPAYAYPSIVQKGDAYASPRTSWAMMVFIWGGSWPFFNFTITVDGVSVGAQYYSADVFDGNWHLLVGVKDSSNLYLYVDGTLQDTQAHSFGSIATNDPMFIGGNKNASGDWGEPWSSFDGEIDKLRIYQDALDQADVTDLYNGQSIAKTPVALYEFEGDFTDSSGNGHDATEIVGDATPQGVEFADGISGSSFGVGSTVDDDNLASLDESVADQFSEADLVSGSGNPVAVVVRFDGSNYYSASIAQNTIDLNRQPGDNLLGQITNIGSSPTVRLEVIGTTLRVLVDGDLALTVTDANISTGVPAIYIYSNLATDYIDNWSAGSLDPRIYPLLLPQKPTYPSVIYQDTETGRIRTLGGSSSMKNDGFDLDIFGDSHLSAFNVAEALRTALDSYRGDMGSLSDLSSRLINQAESFEPEIEKFRFTQSWQFDHK